MHRIWTFAIVSVALFMVVLDNLVVTTALPSIRADLGATIQSLEWTVNAYTLSYAVLLLTGAALGDRFGRKRFSSSAWPSSRSPRRGPRSRLPRRC
jgi:MFS family permease